MPTAAGTAAAEWAPSQVGGLAGSLALLQQTVEYKKQACIVQQHTSNLLLEVWLQPHTKHPTMIAIGAVAATLSRFHVSHTFMFLCRWFPPWHTLPGTRLVVDCFGNMSKHLACQSWFLTHFHADHYMGLTKQAKKGVIYCTPVTAALVQLKLRVPKEKLRVLPLDQTTEVEGACTE